MDVHPLIFEPILKSRLWGGRRLASLAKSLPEGPIGESWEIADLEADQSVVARGPSRGRTLRELMHEWKESLIGGAELFEGRFPLLIKFLDAAQALSVQVHPDQAMAAKQGGSVRIKNEAWYVVEAAPGACIYRGLAPGVDRARLSAAIERGEVESVLRRIEVAKGRCYYLPSGTLHALGAGVVVAEVQTPSDVTYRVFDWNRVDPSTGAGRPLHVEEALQCVSFDEVDPEYERRQHITSVWTSVTRLVHCESFTIERVRMADGVELPIPHAEMVIWVMLEGSAELHFRGAGSPMAIGVGDTVLLPAGLTEGSVHARGGCMWLEVTVPVPSSLRDFERPESDRRGAEPHSGFIPLNIARGNIDKERTGDP